MTLMKELKLPPGTKNTTVLQSLGNHTQGSERRTNGLLETDITLKGKNGRIEYQTENVSVYKRNWRTTIKEKRNSV